MTKYKNRIARENEKQAFQGQSDHQLMLRYNQELKNPNASKEVFLAAFTEELQERGIGFDAIASPTGTLNLDMENDVFLSGKKIFLVSDFKAKNATLTLHFKQDRTPENITCAFKRTKAYSLQLLQLLEETEGAMLVSFEHEQLQTLIDGTGIHHFLMAGFDAHNQLIGVSFFNQSGTGTFGIQTQAKSILVFPQHQFEFYAAEMAGFELVMQ
jgi:hypothetical protein